MDLLSTEVISGGGLPAGRRGSGEDRGPGLVSDVYKSSDLLESAEVMDARGNKDEE